MRGLDVQALDWRGTWISEEFSSQGEHRGTVSPYIIEKEEVPFGKGRGVTKGRGRGN